MTGLKGHHSISSGGGGGGFVADNNVFKPAENAKFYHMFYRTVIEIKYLFMQIYYLFQKYWIPPPFLDLNGGFLTMR